MKTFAELLKAQLLTVQPCVDSYLDFTGSDDRWDYLKGALSLSYDMLMIDMDFAYDQNDEQLLAVLNLQPWANYACDGLANEIYEWLESMGITDDTCFDIDQEFKWTELPKEVTK